jgi:hypothetical protein
VVGLVFRREHMSNETDYKRLISEIAALTELNEDLEADYIKLRESKVDGISRLSRERGERIKHLEECLTYISGHIQATDEIKDLAKRVLTGRT